MSTEKNKESGYVDAASFKAYGMGDIKTVSQQPSAGPNFGTKPNVGGGLDTVHQGINPFDEKATGTRSIDAAQKMSETQPGVNHRSQYHFTHSNQ